MWFGAHIVALIKGWKIALACMSFSPLIIIIAAITIRVSRTEQNNTLLDIKEASSYCLDIEAECK